MTNEELLQITDDKLVEKFIGSWVIAMEDIGPVPPLEVRQRAKNAHAQFKAELLCRLGAAVSASPQPRCKVCNGSDLIVTPFGDFLLNIFCNGCGHEMRYEHPCDLRTLVGAFFAAAPAQEPRQDLYVISSTGDGAQTIIVPESRLRQSAHDTYCSCGLAWQKCADEAITETLAKLDDEEEWTQEYPNYKRHTWSDHGEDYTVTIMRVTAAQEQPVENSPQLDDSRCAICGWPLAESVEKGCTRGNCSMRPFPDNIYDPARANKEYKTERFTTSPQKGKP